MFGLAPWRNKEVNAVKNEMEELFDLFFKDYPLIDTPCPFGWIPSMDVSQTEDAVMVRLELPGMEAKDIDISLRENLLTIRGEKKRWGIDCNEDFHRTECSCGYFQRSVRLPLKVDADRVEAVYEKGLLKIVLPRHKPTREKMTTIPVR